MAALDYGVPLIEAVCCSVDDVIAAERAGAHRIELCSSIEVGGLTPSIGLLHEALASTSLPVIALVRCRAGGFSYSPSELRVMRRDAELVLVAGATGIAFGCLRPDSSIDREGCNEVIGGLSGERVFHRAFDETSDLGESLETAIGLGFTRILTSGGSTTALEGAETLASLRIAGEGRIQILAAGAIRGDNAAEVVRRSGVDQIHMGPFIGRETAGKYGAELRLDELEVAQVVSSLCTMRLGKQGD